MDFNPRSHEESDINNISTDEVTPKISIHALTKRATRKLSKALNGLGYFNPRSHEESDGIKAIKWEEEQKFQSTLSRRERLDLPLRDGDTERISIHALTKRAT